MPRFVQPGFVQPGFIVEDEEIPVLIPYVSLGGRMGATMWGASGALDIPRLAMAAVAGLWALWHATRAWWAATRARHPVTQEGTGAS